MGTSLVSPASVSGSSRDTARRAAIHVAGLKGARSLFAGCAEPPLSEVMDDPVVRRLMARDGVAEDALLGLIDQVRGYLR